MIKLILKRIFEYYDVPQLFLAEDVVDGQYLCLLYNIEDDGELKYISVKISNNRLNDFIKGHIDLRSIFIKPEIDGDYYSVTFQGKEILAGRYDGAIEEPMLPEDGYFYDDDQYENNEMIMRANTSKHPVVRLAFETPSNRHVIDTRCLSAALVHFQSLIDNSYKKLYKNEDVKNAKLNVTTYSAASFDIEFIAEEQLDLFGESTMGRTLAVINDLFSGDDEVVVNTLRRLKGLAVNSYKSFIEVLLDNDMTINLKWVHNAIGNEVRHNSVDKKYIKGFQSIVNANKQLAIEELSFEGLFTAANTRNGRWTFNQQEGRRLNGDSDGDVLSGVTLVDKPYRITCVVEQSLNETTLRTTTTYKLVKIEPLS